MTKLCGGILLGVSLLAAQQPAVPNAADYQQALRILKADPVSVPAPVKGKRKGHAAPAI